jgi:tetratricopeptide (TPR) repeat protein
VACGFRTAAFNNRAYSYLQLHMLSEAQGDLDEALRLEPGLFAAHRSSVYLAFRYRFERLTQTVDAALDHAEKALQGKPQDPVVYVFAARLYALAARDNAGRQQEYRDKAIDYLREALGKGAKPSTLNESTFRSLADHPSYPELRAMPAVRKADVQSCPSLVDPLAPAKAL